MIFILDASDAIIKQESSEDVWGFLVYKNYAMF